MTRTISPPVTAIDELRQPLTDGEREVFEHLEANLREDWEIYIQPHMNGLRPDFVLLHEETGIVVVEVKDWDLSAIEYEVEESSDGNAPKLYLTKDGDRYPYNRHNPFNQVNLYWEEVLDLYCPSFEKDPKQAWRVVSGFVIFTRSARQQIVELFDPILQYYNIPKQHNEYTPGARCIFAGSDDLADKHILDLHPFFGCLTKPGMSKSVAADLRHWLVEPDVSAMQRRSLPLDARQKELVLTRNNELHRKIKGPAGSGKSLVLAARAAQLCLERKDVLLITYNITLLNYLEDLAVRWPEPGISPIRKYLHSLNFHRWCKRIALEAGAETSYKELWGKHFEAEKKTENHDSAGALDSLLDKQMAIVINGIIASHSRDIERYDAILVDEGQDFNPDWWNCLRKLLIPGGEMLLVADESQDIYEKSALWTEDSMKGCGLASNWVQLENSYRIPNELIPILKDFADRFIPEKQINLPQENKDKNNILTKLRWRQTIAPNIINAAFEEIVAMAGIKLPTVVPFADVTIAVSNKATGISLIKRLAKEKINVIHTFDLKADTKRGEKADNRLERRKKMYFFKGDARIKITTIHSLKGLESRSLVLCLENLDPSLNSKLLYTGMTRLKGSYAGSHMTVVSSVNELINHGSTWPEYQNDVHPQDEKDA